MIICQNCYKKMKATKTGVLVRFTKDGHHTYSGDKYVCDECDNTIVVTAECNFESLNPTYTEHDVWMDLTPLEHNKKQYPTINFDKLINEYGCKYCEHCELLCESVVEEYICHKNKWTRTITNVKDHNCDMWEVDTDKTYTDEITDVDDKCIQDEYYIDNK